MEPRLHDSYGSRGTSPQGLVHSMRPIAGVGLYLLIVSKKISPGSPEFHALFMIWLHISFAFTFFTVSLLCGPTSSHSFSSATAFIKSSVAPTEILKFVSVFPSRFML